jgi:hypothetical protein
MAIDVNKIKEEYMEKGCPCGKKGPGSNFYCFVGDYHFYCGDCLPKLHDRFIKDMEVSSFDEACERSKSYLKMHKD